jgi:hypothetical protein
MAVPGAIAFADRARRSGGEVMDDQPALLCLEFSDIQFCLARNLLGGMQWYTMQGEKNGPEAIAVFRSKDHALAFRQKVSLGAEWLPVRLKRDGLLDWLRQLVRMGIGYIAIDTAVDFSSETMHVCLILEMLASLEE